MSPSSPPSIGGSRVRLHVVPADGHPFEHLFEGDSLVIGRSSSAGLAIADRFLSRQHSRLFRDGGGSWSRTSAPATAPSSTASRSWSRGRS
ncbi:MAG: FHA domain-containing protein [Thermoanaerobaculia bacterium]|nr:FHA domain-containing protein [Thermoanaerobaculia bacterium]